MTEMLPKPKAAMIRRIEEFLDTRWPSKRPRELAPSVLAVLVELDLSGRPYPGRHVMAKQLGSTKDAIDSVINTAKARGLLTVRVELVPGLNFKVESTRQEKHLVPSSELLDVALGR